MNSQAAFHCDHCGQAVYKENAGSYCSRCEARVCNDPCMADHLEEEHGVYEDDDD